jgi:hypothetical protein
LVGVGGSSWVTGNDATASDFFPGAPGTQLRSRWLRIGELREELAVHRAQSTLTQPADLVFPTCADRWPYISLMLAKGDEVPYVMQQVGQPTPR